MKKLINRICDSIIRAAQAIEAENDRKALSQAKVVWENTADEYCRVKPLGVYRSEIGTLEFTRSGRVYISTLGGSDTADTSLECGRLLIGVQGGAVAEYDAWADTVAYLGYTFVSTRVPFAAETGFAA